MTNNNMWFPSKNNLKGYVYLNSLNDEDGPEEAKAIAKSFLNQYNSLFLNEKATITGQKMPFIDQMHEALQFLINIRDSEQAKEIAAIENKKRSLLKISNPNNIIKEQIKILDNINNGATIDEINLINAVNVTEQDFKTYKRRLKELNSSNYTMPEVASRFEYQIHNIANTFLRAISENSKSQISTKKNAQILMTHIQTALQKQNFPEELIPALAGTLLIDIEAWAANNDEININLTQNDLDFKTILTEYYAQSDSYLSQILQQPEQNLPYLQRIAKDFESQFHIASDSILIEQYNQLEERLKQLKAKHKKNLSDQEKEELTKIKEKINKYKNRFKSSADSITFRIYSTSSSKTQHGFTNEFIRTLARNALNAKGNIATDTITMLYEISSQSAPYLNQLLTDIGNIHEDFLHIQQHITVETLNQSIQEHRQAQEKMYQQIEATEQQLIPDNSENFFISHESLKLYQTVETHTQKEQGFSGRSINVLTALSNLYSATELEARLMDKEVLLTFLINISTATLGFTNKRPLENYLSLFAGLLMFDDIHNICQDAVKYTRLEASQKQATGHQIHVYAINNVFFPLSIILTNIISQIDDTFSFMINTVNSGKTATINISAPNEIFSSGYTQADWIKLANSVIQQTKIKVHFLSGFNQFIQNLGNTNGI